MDLSNEENTWFEKIEKPIIGLAPMHGFTDSDFRLKCREAGADVVYSEMVAAEAIIRHIPKAMEMLSFNKEERPIVLQIFGNNPESMKAAAQVISRELKPDGIDINFGCPVQKAAKQGFGAIQVKDLENAYEVARAVVDGAPETPVSVKMRMPSNTVDETIEFIKKMQEAGVKLITIHGRTLTQKYKGQADWVHIREVKKHFPDFPILGNGDIKTLEDLKRELGNLDGALIGRAAKINYNVFADMKKIKSKSNPN